MRRHPPQELYGSQTLIPRLGFFTNAPLNRPSSILILGLAALAIAAGYDPTSGGTSSELLEIIKGAGILPLLTPLLSREDKRAALVADFAEGVAIARLIRGNGMYLESGRAPANERLSEVAKDFIAHVLALTEGEWNEFVPTHTGFEHVQIRRGDLMLWAVAHMLDPRLHDPSIQGEWGTGRVIAKTVTRADIQDSISAFLIDVFENIPPAEVGQLVEKAMKSDSEWASLGLVPPDYNVDFFADSMAQRLTRIFPLSSPLREPIFNIALLSQWQYHTDYHGERPSVIRHEYRKYPYAVPTMQLLKNILKTWDAFRPKEYFPRIDPRSQRHRLLLERRRILELLEESGEVPTFLLTPKEQMIVSDYLADPHWNKRKPLELITARQSLVEKLETYIALQKQFSYGHNMFMKTRMNLFTLFFSRNSSLDMLSEVSLGEMLTLPRLYVRSYLKNDQLEQFERLLSIFNLSMVMHIRDQDDPTATRLLALFPLWVPSALTLAALQHLFPSEAATFGAMAIGLLSKPDFSFRPGATQALLRAA